MTHSEILHIPDETFSKMKVTLDWEYLASGKGLRKAENVFQVILGRILFWFVIMVNVGIVLSQIRAGSLYKLFLEAQGIVAFIFWIFVIIFLYSLYLLRNRELFLDRKRIVNLRILRKRIQNGKPEPSIELSDYINHKLLWMLDYILNVSGQDYLSLFWKKLVKLPRVEQMIKRLGLDDSKIDVSILDQIGSSYVKTAVVKDILLDSFIFAYQNRCKYVNEESIMVVFLEKFLKDYLQQFTILPKDIEGLKLWIRNEAIREEYVEDWKWRVSVKPKSSVNRAYTSRFTPMLNQFSRDFTQEVIRGDFVVSIARERELDNLVAMLEKGEKSAVLLVGEPGVGKTTMLKTLAVRMVVEDIPSKLQDKRLVGFDFNKAFTSSSDTDSFKQKLHTIFEEVSAASNVILVMDNINQLLNLRQDVAGELVNIIIDAFDSGRFRMIATIDRNDYVRFLRPHKGLAGLFGTVEISIPTDEITAQIVMDEVPKIERDYGVKIAYTAIKGSIELSHKFSYERVLPDKAIDILKETVVNFKHLTGKKPIEYEEVAQVISSKVGVSLGAITEDESAKLTRLEQEMHKRVIGQDAAVNAVSAALRRSRSGLVDSKKPVASFLFYGPTGVGKTEVAKTVAQVYYGNEQRMIRLDMSEYHEEENLKRLIGFTSEQGSFEGGFLTEPVFANPFSLILLDEIEKANPKVLDLFLQVLDEGTLDDGLGRRVDFSNTIIIATSNAGSSVIATLLEQGEGYDAVHVKALEELKRVFRIEFLNRFDKIIMFKSLTQREVTQVAHKFVEQIRLKLLDKGITLVYDEALLERLGSLGYNPVFGAREMKRIVQEEVENKIADMVVRAEVRAGGEVRLT